MRHQENFQDLRKSCLSFVKRYGSIVATHVDSSIQRTRADRFNRTVYWRTIGMILQNDCAYRKVIEKRNDECKGD